MHGQDSLSVFCSVENDYMSGGGRARGPGDTSLIARRYATSTDEQMSRPCN